MRWSRVGFETAKIRKKIYAAKIFFPIDVVAICVVSASGFEMFALVDGEGIARQANE